MSDTGRGDKLVGGRPSQQGDTSTWASERWAQISRAHGAYPDVLRTLERMRDYNPDASLAVWNTLRLANRGHELEVFKAKPAADGSQVADDKGKAYLEELCRRVGPEYGGGLDTLIDVLHLTLITQGAMAAELELSEDLAEVLDYCPVNPRKISFVRDPESKKRVPAVQKLGEYIVLNPNQFRYLPLDPDVDQPYGRSPMWSAIEAVFFQMDLMRDLQAVAHNQGYPRIDVSVLQEIVIDNTPEHLKDPGAEDDLRAWLDGFLSDLRAQYEQLQPDDTFIHWDAVKVGYVGPGQAGSLSIDSLLEALDRMMIAGLKQLPVLLGRNEGATTTHATVQWQIYAAGIEALNRRTKRLLEWMHNTALRIAGIQSYARVTFTPLRKVDREAEARAEATETNTLILQVHAGWITNDEAAMQATGHAARAPMMILPRPVASSLDLEEVPAAGERALGLVAPEGVPYWLWQRSRATAEVYRDWADNTFQEGKAHYLAGAAEASLELGTLAAGGDGEGPPGEL